MLKIVICYFTCKCDESDARVVSHHKIYIYAIAVSTKLFRKWLFIALRRSMSLYHIMILDSALHFDLIGC